MKGCVAMSSASDFCRDNGLIHEAVVTGRKAGWGAEEWAKLAHDEEMIRNFRKVLLGHAVITVPEHLIDCDADPFTPDGWKVEEHRKGAQFKWDVSKVSLYLSEPQKRGKSIRGNKLRDELKDQSVYNANVLDYLLKNPHLIPEEWKGKYVFFWGTIYRHSDGSLFVRYLCWRFGRWNWHYFWLGSDWSVSDPAALRAS